MKFHRVYEYIRNYFQRNFPESYIILEKFDMRPYFEEYIEIQKVFDGKNLSEGKYDDEIHQYLSNYVKGYFTKLQISDCSTLYGYVQKVLQHRKLNNNFSADIFDHLVKLVMADVYPQYDSSKLYTAELDYLINSTYNRNYNEIIGQINNAIDQLLNTDMNFLINLKAKNLDKNLLKQFVVESILLNEDRQFLEKVSSLVIPQDVMLSETAQSIKKYMNKYVKRDTFKQETTPGDTLEQVATPYVWPNVNINRGQPSNEVQVNHNRQKMRNGSVSHKDVPKEIPYVDGMKKKIIKIVSGLLVVATLGGVGAFAAKNHSKKVNDAEANSRVEALYGYVDDSIYHVGDGANRILDFWDNLVKNEIDDNNYRTLGFYEEYRELYYDIASNKNDVFLALEDMQKVFEQVQTFALGYDENSELRSLVGLDRNKYFFIDFVYDSLASMGCEEVDTAEYQEALKNYKFYSFSNRYGVAVGDLSHDTIVIIEDVMNKYVEYSEQQETNLGYLLGSRRSVG